MPLPFATNINIQPINYDPLLIKSKNDEPIFRIDSEGNIYYKINGEMKKLEDEKELAQLFVICISGVTGYQFQSKDDLFQTISKNYRIGKIDKIFEK